MKIRRIHHTAVSVQDMEASLAFYVGLLDMEVTFDSDIDDREALNEVVGMQHASGRVVWLAAGESMLELWQWDQPTGRPLPHDYRPADRGVTHFALEVDDVNELHQRIVGAGFAANSEPKDLGLHLTTYVRGPDNEFIEILEDRATPEMLDMLTARSAAQRAST